ncbi:MAG: glycosyltransferase family 2 protein [Gammaproteobacteria bacterium]|nr:glycosyltransferase family 2 protein [Gammaproteobacteria bacterium]
MSTHVLTCSVVIPTKDRGQLVRRALSSVLAQSRHADEVIIVDDGSLEPISIDLDVSVDVPLRVIRNESSLGGSAARNKGWECATGDIIMFLDDDDYWDPCKLEAQIGRFCADAEVGLVYTGRIMHDQNGRELYRRRPIARGWLWPSILERNLIGTTSGVAVRRSVLVETGGFDPDMPALQDFDLWIRISRSWKVEHDGGVHVHYRMPGLESNQIGSSAMRTIQANERLIEKYSEYMRSGVRRRRRAGVLARKASLEAHEDWLKAFGTLLRSIWMWPSPSNAARVLWNMARSASVGRKPDSQD